MEPGLRFAASHREQGIVVKKRQTAQSESFGAFLQIAVVGVLLFAVIWQLSGSVEREPVDVDAPAPVVEPTAEPFVTTDEVNLRRGPGLDHEVIRVAPVNAEVLVTGGSLNGFVPVTMDGISAWVAESYVVPEGAVLSGASGDLPVAGVSRPVEPAEDTVEEPVAAEVVTAPDEPLTAGIEWEVEEPGSAVSVEEPAVAVSAMTYAEPAEESAPEEPGERWVDVDRSTALVTLYEGERIVAQFTGLIGKDPSPDGYYSTAVGTFQVHTMTRELAETPFAPGVYLTDFVGFDPVRSNGFHSPTRDANGNVVQTGGTATLGCVRLGENEARQMFDFAFIGMRVEIHD